MKKHLLLVFTLLIFVSVSAQEITVKSFRPLPTDMTASSKEGKRIDQNGQVAALIKVVTNEKGFSFEGGTLGIVDSQERKGEIWVWVPRASRKITILHDQLGILRDYMFPTVIEAERTYEMVLITTDHKIDVHQQFLLFQLDPPDAVLTVDDKLWKVESDGTSQRFVDFGVHSYRVQAADYFTEAGNVTVNDPVNTQKVIVTLKPNFATVTLTVNADAEIWVNGNRKGIRSWTGPLGNDTYKIECRQANHETTVVSKTITSEMNGQTIVLVAPKPIYGSLLVESTPNLCKLFIDGKNMGETPKYFSQILIGQHVIKLTKDNYADYTETINITKGEQKQINATLSKGETQSTTPEEKEKEKEPETTTKPVASEKKPIKYIGYPVVNHSFRLYQQAINSTPTINRSINDILALFPQSVMSTDGLSMGGANYWQSNFTIDGAPANNFYGISGNLPANGHPISLEAIQSIAINNDHYDVRDNSYVGVGINATTKKGTDETHGSVYDYFTNSSLVGTKYGDDDGHGNYPTDLQIPTTMDNIAGLSVGGPIVKGKLHYYVNFEYQSDIDPGQTHSARNSESSDWGGTSTYNRPTTAQMNEIKSYLKSTYNYDPGRYQNYTASSPDYKLFAKMDWRFGNNWLDISYNLSKNKYSSAPSNSNNPFSNLVYNRNNYGRNTPYALYFESARYYQEQSFSSLTGKLTSYFQTSEGYGNNTIRVTYSKQDEPRSFEGNLFPTVDILQYVDEDGDGIEETPALLTTFGPDPYTYGNFRNVSVTEITDELVTVSEYNNFKLGAQFEYDQTKSGFMQAGAGYYVFDSWEDFKNKANPRAFAMSYGNNSNHEQVAPSYKHMQGSLYLQDDMELSDIFHLSLGLRAEVPYYPSIASYNTNKDFQSIVSSSETMRGLSTADMPKTRIELLPRFSFEFGDFYERVPSVVFSGGTGFFTSRIPNAWLVSAVSNSNCLVSRYVNNNYETNIGFSAYPDEIIAYNSDLLTIGDQPAPTAPTIIDTDLRMPKIWRSSLKLSFNPIYSRDPNDGFNISFEGIYNKEIQSIAVTRLGIIKDGSIQLPGEPSERDHWVSEGITNSQGDKVQPFYLTNSQNNGYNLFLTARVSKLVGENLNFIATYTYGMGKNVMDGAQSQVSSIYSANTHGINGSNSHELGYASNITPHRILLYAGFNFGTSEHHNNTLGIYYEGRNLAYIGSYSYCRYSYTMTTNVNGDGGANSLLYIPTIQDLYDMPFVSDENKDEYNSFIRSDKYLNAHRGEYAERGGAIAPMFHTINFHYSHEFLIATCKLQLGFDLMNLANLVNRSWGNMQYLSNSNILRWDGTNYTFTSPQWSERASTVSTWSAALNVRFSF